MCYCRKNNLCYVRKNYSSTSGRTPRPSLTWFNPPYNKSETSNISRDFPNLISKHIPNHNPLAKIFNRNNIKVSYICTNNITLIIKGHNKNIETIDIHSPPNKQCNCRDKEACSLLGNCLQKNILYRGTAKTNNLVMQFVCVLMLN